MIFAWTDRPPAGFTKPSAPLQVAGVEVGNESYLVVCEYSPAGNVNTPQVRPAFDLSQARRCLQAMSRFLMGQLAANAVASP